MMQHWDLLAAAILVVAVALMLGWRQAIVVLLAVVSLVSYRRGRKDERVVDEAKRKEQNDAYNKIDADGRSGSDSVDRLRNGKF